MAEVHRKCSCCGREIAHQYWDIVLDEARSDLLREECYGGVKNGKHYCKDCFEGKTEFSINILRCCAPYILSFKGKEYELSVGRGSVSMDESTVSAAYSSSRKLKEDLGVDSSYWHVCFRAKTPDIVDICGKEYKFKGELLNRSDAKCKITVLEEVS